ncbi:hypothetical protein [Micromonospora rubida]
MSIRQKRLADVLGRRFAAAVVAIAVGMAALLTGPTAAHAADKNPYSASGLCGAGYYVLDVNPADGDYYIYVLYNRSTGKNCVVTLKQNHLGVKTPVDARVKVQGGSWVVDRGSFSYYAGPVYVNAADKCIQWGGYAYYYPSGGSDPYWIGYESFPEFCG